MKLDRTVFAMDVAEFAAQTAASISARARELHRSGIVVPLSGGLDSSTVLLLCARAVGPERVTALLMPERARGWDAMHFAESVARQAGVAIVLREIGDALVGLGVGPLPVRPPSREMSPDVSALVGKFRRKSFLRSSLQRRSTEGERVALAQIGVRHRVRSAVAMQVAEERNGLLVGAAHRSEAMVGLFIRFGVDDNADVMPLRDLYRTQILELAACVGVPEEIIERPPNPEIAPGIEDKYRDILGLDSATLDLILFGIAHGVEEIAAQVGVPEETVEDVREIVALTAWMR